MKSGSKTAVSTILAPFAGVPFVYWMLRIDEFSFVQPFAIYIILLLALSAVGLPIYYLIFSHQLTSPKKVGQFLAIASIFSVFVSALIIWPIAQWRLVVSPFCGLVIGLAFLFLLGEMTLSKKERVKSRM